MDIRLYCTHCGGCLTVSPERIGRPVTCATCRATIDTMRLSDAHAAPPPGIPVYSPFTHVQSTRSRVAAGILGILFGGFGAHRFYLGFVGIGVVQMIVTCATCGLGSLWGFIEGIFCLAGAMRDIDGRPLRD